MNRRLIVGSCIPYTKFTRKNGVSEMQIAKVTKVGRKYFETDCSTFPVPFDTMSDRRSGDDGNDYYFSVDEYSKVLCQQSVIHLLQSIKADKIHLLSYVKLIELKTFLENL